MGRFSCFYGYVPSNKQKKAGQPSFETMVKMLRIDSQNNGSENTVNPITLDEFPTNMGIRTDHHALTSRTWNSGELKCDYDAESNVDSLQFQLGNIRRSLSVGCDMYQKGRTYDECTAQVFSCEASHDGDDTVELLPKILSKSMGTSLVDQDQEFPQSLSPQLSGDAVNNESLSLYIECPYSSGQNSPNHPRISKCYSMPNFGSTSPVVTGHSACVVATHERSFEDLSMLSNKEENNSAHEAVAAEVAELNRIDGFSNPEIFDEESAVLDNFDSYDYSGSSKDWMVPISNEIGMMKHSEGNFSCDHWDQYTNEEFKIKQTEEWVIRLQHCSPVEEINELADSCDEVKRGSEYLDDLVKVDFKVDPGMEAAKRYISSLTATATSAQLANFGLVAIPLLSAFVSLKVINLSGNAIVKITAGALPRGLHMLNLSKNKISTIEGLRELTRLRVLDLSYNKLSRIGHGLASCSTLKELYLAGNKISEVEGLHRLLKLTVLDLRFNKIATSKCLGQLAANYISLQAISLEGNPAQKNVGDEQLKKHLQGLLPQLAYYNRQNIKSSTLKDSSDRSVRLGISDRGLRSDHKSSSRRGSGAPKRSSHSSVHGQKGQASDSLKQSKGKHVLVPPSGAKSSHRHQHFDIGNKLQSLRSGLSLHKSRSEGTLAVL